MNEAFRDLYAKSATQVLALCRRLLDDDHEAQDAAQETFVLALSAFDTFRGEANPQTWVFRIALRLCLRRRATQKRRPKGEETHLANIIDPAAPPDERASTRQTSERVESAMRALPAEQQAVLALFAVDGLSHAGIAKVLGVPERTVWSRLHTARRKVIEALERP